MQKGSVREARGKQRGSKWEAKGEQEGSSARAGEAARARGKQRAHSGSSARGGSKREAKGYTTTAPYTPHTTHTHTQSNKAPCVRYPASRNLGTANSLDLDSCETTASTSVTRSSGRNTPPFLSYSCRRPSSPEDVYGIALCMRHVLPSSVVHYTLFLTLLHRHLRFKQSVTIGGI